MKHIFSILILGFIGAGAAVWGVRAGQEPGDYTIKTTTRLVLLDVLVRTPQGALVSGLEKSSFHVFEDGKEQPITQFAAGDTPVTVGIVIDESGSMRPKKPEVITAALGFISDSNPKDEMFVLNFNEHVKRGLPDTVLFSDDIKQLRAALWSGTPTGRTALYDAIVAGLQQLEMGRQGRKTLMVISDGGDNVSSAKFKDVQNDVLDSVATIYTIGVFDNDDPDKNPDVLKKLAQVSGGEAFFPTDIHDIVPICRKIAKDVRSRYTVGYIPNTEGKNLRHIKVTVSAPDHGKLVAKTRTEYLMNDVQSADRTK